MTHLYIELNTGLTEEVDNKIIEKLYDTVTNNILDETSDLKGRLHSVGANEAHIEYLTQNFPLLFIQVDKLYINFEDPEVEQILLEHNIGDGEGVTRLEAASSNISGLFNLERSTIKKFNEFRYFNKNIPENCFCNCLTLLSIILPDECTTLSYRAFFIALNYYNIPRTLTQVGGLNHISYFRADCFQRLWALVVNEEDLAEAVTIETGSFWYVKVLSINCPKLTSLGSSAFRENNNLTEIKCLGKISNIHDNVFDTCKGLQTATLPYECTEIKSNAFATCSSLTTLKLYTSSVDEWIEGEEPTKTNISRITTFRNSCFRNCSSLVLLNSDIENATIIESSAFYNTKLTGNINLSNLLGNKIPSECFRGCKQLTSIQLPNTVTTIENYAFSGCTSLTSIDLSNITTTSGEKLFEETNLTTVAFNANNYLTTLSSRIFVNCSSLTTVTGLSNITTLDAACFSGCTSLLTIDIDNSKITFLGGQCFYGCSNLSNLVTVNFPNLLTLGTTYSSREQFRSCSLILHVVNLGSITEIGDVYAQGTFHNCTNLQTATFPETLQTLRYSGLTGCPNIRWVKLLSTSVPYYNTTNGFNITKSYGNFFGESFRNDDISNEYLGSTYPIYVKDELVNDYKSAVGFSPIAFRIKPLSLFATDFPNG